MTARRDTAAVTGSSPTSSPGLPPIAGTAAHGDATGGSQEVAGGAPTTGGERAVPVAVGGESATGVTDVVGGDDVTSVGTGIARRSGHAGVSSANAMCRANRLGKRASNPPKRLIEEV